jgi:hypothetical protein
MRSSGASFRRRARSASPRNFLRHCSPRALPNRRRRSGRTTDPPVEDASPLRGLLLIVINAILYATSAGVEPVLRVAGTPRSKRTSRRRPEERKSSSEDVYHLPGAIEISQLRRYQSLDRIPDGRQALHRFMVRGHWRRASKNWTDQRMRWIEPYWKGPDVAAVVERTYKLKQ